MHVNTFSKYMLYVFVFIYTHNKYTQYTYILCKHNLLFWMRLIIKQQIRVMHRIKVLY